MILVLNTSLMIIMSDLHVETRAEDPFIWFPFILDPDQLCFINTRLDNNLYTKMKMEFLAYLFNLRNNYRERDHRTVSLRENNNKIINHITFTISVYSFVRLTTSTTISWCYFSTIKACCSLVVYLDQSALLVQGIQLKSGMLYCWPDTNLQLSLCV